MPMRNALSVAHRNRQWRSGLFATLVAATMGCGSSGGGTPTNPGGGGNNPPGNPVVTTSVNLTGNAFSPPAIQVSPGATVTYTNLDGIDHNVTFSSTAITSTGNFSTGAKAVVMPTAAGTYAYHCTIHSGMNGSVVVP